MWLFWNVHFSILVQSAEHASFFFSYIYPNNLSLCCTLLTWLGIGRYVLMLAEVMWQVKGWPIYIYVHQRIRTWLSTLWWCIIKVNALLDRLLLWKQSRIIKWWLYNRLLSHTIKVFCTEIKEYMCCLLVLALTCRPPPTATIITFLVCEFPASQSSFLSLRWLASAAAIYYWDDKSTH